jgi:hypothetical protein
LALFSVLGFFPALRNFVEANDQYSKKNVEVEEKAGMWKEGGRRGREEGRRREGGGRRIFLFSRNFLGW